MFPPVSIGCLRPNRLQLIDPPSPEHRTTSRQPTLVETVGEKTGPLSPIIMLGSSNAAIVNEVHVTFNLRDHQLHKVSCIPKNLVFDDTHTHLGTKHDASRATFKREF